MTEKKTVKGRSPWHHARRRFFRNIPAMIGLSVLFICAVVSVFAYFLMPDPTTNANYQIVELPKQPPGTEAWMILENSLEDQEKDEEGWFRFLLNGKKDLSRPIPLSGPEEFYLEGDTLFYIDLRGNRNFYLFPEFMLNINKEKEEAQVWKLLIGKPYIMIKDTRVGKDSHITNDTIFYFNKLGEMNHTTMREMELRFLNQHYTSKKFIFGTDGQGRDVLSRLILGTRISLSVGFMSVVVSLVLGIFLGAMAGFFRGWVDQVVMWFVSVVWSIPTLLLAISIAFVLGKGTWQLFFAIGISTWVEVARIVRGQIFSVRELQYVEATRAMGFRYPRVIMRHVLPNILSPVIIISAANFASAILIEAGLSFLGVGVNAPVPSWGSMIREGYTQVMFDTGIWLAIIPGCAIILVVISLNLVGFGLRDALDPKYDH